MSGPSPRRRAHLRVDGEDALAGPDERHPGGDAAGGKRLRIAAAEDRLQALAGAKILDGVTIGVHAVVGAGAVVRDEVPPYAVAVGMPARVVSTRAR